MVTLYRDTYERRYISDKCSTATCFCMLILIATIVLPFMLAFSTGNFWKKVGIYHEQADVKFRGGALIGILEDDGTGTESGIKVKTFSTVNGVLQSTAEDADSQAVPMITALSEDGNNDQIADNIRIRVSVPSTPRNVQNMKVVLDFEYSISSMAKMDMQGAIFLDIPSYGSGISRVDAIGDLQFRQVNPLSIGSITKRVNDKNIFENMENSDFLNGYRKYSERNETTRFNGQFIVSPYGADATTTLNLLLKIPIYQEFKYMPPFLETIKFAWIQYFSMLYPTYILLFGLLCFVFKYQILETGITNNLPKKDKVKSF